MERCRSSEPVLGTPFTTLPHMDRKHETTSGRGGRARDVKATSLLFKSVPSSEQVVSTEKAEWSHIEGQTRREVVQEDEKMDIDGEEGEQELASASALLHEPEEPVVWGMPKWGRENERGGEVRKGVRLVGMEEVSL